MDDYEKVFRASVEDPETWRDLATEALAYVSGQGT